VLEKNKKVNKLTWLIRIMLLNYFWFNTKR
jgi:hypothetical protein